MSEQMKITPKKMVIIAVTFVFFCFQMYLALVKQLNPVLQASLHLSFAITVVYLYNPLDKKYRKKITKAAEREGRTVDEAVLNKYSKLNYLDILAYIGIAFMFYYCISQNDRLTQFVPFISPVLVIDKVFMVVTIALLLDSVRRTLGNVLLVFIIIFIIYAFTAQYLPGILYTKGKPLPQMLDQFTTGMTITTSGIFGTPLYTSASSLFYFIVFGVFFSVCGGGQLLIDIGLKFSNSSSGGPAKAAVISSGLMGMVSGSAVANVSTTGVMTIPMMKKIGYEPHEAGAIEAVASTGGQVMPPIMGVGAFIMAEMLGISYFKVATAAILPALAYYVGVFVLVTYLARKRAARKGGAEDIKIEIGQSITKRLYLLIPVILLVYCIITGYSLMRAGMIGIFSCLACNVISYFVSDRVNFVNIKGLGQCCLDGAKQAAEIAIPTAACGIIINVVTGQTSLATNLASVISALGTNYLFIALLIGMLGCMMLGMALPTVAAYLVGVILFVPAIRPLLTEALNPIYSDPGTVNLCANMFVFYYGIMAQITPPVCVASYTAAGIADADAMKTGIHGMLYALVGFLVPFVFIYNPAILLQGTLVQIVFGAAQLLVGTYFLALGVAGFYKADLKTWERAAVFAVAIGLIAPSLTASLVAIVGGVVVLAINTRESKKITPTAA